MNDKIIIYVDEAQKIHLKLKLDHETLWLSLNQMAELFDRDKSVISKHIKNICNVRA